MHLVMMGTGPFAVPTFRGLFDTHHEIRLLVTAPLRQLRGQWIVPVSDIRDVAHEHGVPIFDPEQVNTAEAQSRIRAEEPDLLVVCDYGQILSAETLAAAALGGLNLHGSLLPKYRGAAPINWAIYHGELETGATVIHMTPRVDAGPCVGQVRTPIGPTETAVDVERRLAEMGAWLVRRTIDALEAGRLELLPQDPALASRAPRLKKTDAEIDWTRSAAAVFNQIRAFEPWPRNFTFWHREQGPAVRWILGHIELAAASDVRGALQQRRGEDASAVRPQLGSAPQPANGVTIRPGTILRREPARLLVMAGEGGLWIDALQASGKRAMSVEEYLRGNRVQAGDTLGPEPLCPTAAG